MVDGRPASHREILKIAEVYAKCGIFSVDDMGHRTGTGLDAKTCLAGKIAVRSAGYAIYKKGGYGAFLGKGVSGKGEIEKVVREIADAGIDFIKVINSGVVSFGGMQPVTAGGFTLEELGIIHSEAEERGLEMICHANSDSAIRDAVVAGAASIEHGFFVSEETLHMMAEKGVSWSPTAFALLNNASSLSPDQRSYIEGVVDAHLSSVRYACSAGVKLHVGTDSGSKGLSHGGSFFEELRLFRKAGLTNEQILSAACMDAGEIEKGNYLLIGTDFIEEGGIEAMYVRGELQT
jgi:imidazolonepropionase-like amidohydrolase